MIRVIIESPFGSPDDEVVKAYSAYQVTNIITGSRYIGITCRTLRKRWGDHCSKSNAALLGRAIRKYGRDAFVIEKVACAATYDNLKELEKILIAQEQTKTIYGGYNLTDGGDGTVGRPTSVETKEKIRAASIAAMRNPERRLRLSECATKQWSTPEARAIISRANKGRKHSEETRLKVSVAGKNRPPRSLETRHKLAAALRGKRRPDEVRAKISASKIGTKMSAEAKAKMSASSKGKPKSETMRSKLRAYHARRRQERSACCELS